MNRYSLRYASGVLGIGLTALIAGMPFLLAGCGANVAGVTEGKVVKPEQALASIKETLKENRPTIDTYKSVVSQLNTYIGLAPEKRDAIKATPEYERAIKESVFRQAPLEIYTNVVKPAGFLTVDAHYLDYSYLFRDAAAALSADLPSAPGKNSAERPAYDRKLAKHAFDWTMRQIHLQPRGPNENERWPAHTILRRGTGDAEERGRVFLALLDQLDIDAGYVTRLDRGDAAGKPIPWLVGVRVGGDLLLFDPLLGKPFPSPQRSGDIATLAEVRAAANDPTAFDSWLAPIYQKKLNDPIKASQVAKCELWVASLSPALAPRMRELEQWLADDEDTRIKLYQDLPALLKRLQDVAGPDSVAAWATDNLPGHKNAFPAELLTAYVDVDARNTLQKLVVPRNILLRNGARIGQFNLIPRWVETMEFELADGGRHPERAVRLYQRFDGYFLRLRLLSGGVRDVLVRGRPEQTIDMLLEREEALDRAMDIIFRREDPSRRLHLEWGKKLTEAWKGITELETQLGPAASRDGVPGDIREKYAMLLGTIEALWKEEDESINNLSLAWAEPDLREHLTYFMGLAQMEMAIRAQMRAERTDESKSASAISPLDQWAAALAWFERYEALVLPKPRNHWMPAVREHMETCKAAIADLKKKPSEP